MNYADRLTALAPKNPIAYYELAEEVADASDGFATRRLAIRLYVLAYTLDRARPDAGDRGRLAASACLALSALSGAPRDRAWLNAVARLMDPRQAGPEWTGEQEPATTDSASYLVATLLGQVRAGEGIKARQLLEDAAVREALERYNRMMTRMGSMSARAVEREAGRWRCSECDNARVVKRVQGGAVETRLCSNCKGNPGPVLTTAELAAQLRFESWLLQGTQRSWAAQLGADDGAPLIDADPGSVAANFDVDPTLVLWRDGRWVKDPTAPATTPKEKPAEINAEPAKPMPTSAQ